MAKWRSYGKGVIFPTKNSADGITDPSINFLLNKVVDKIESRYLIRWEDRSGKQKRKERRAGKGE